MVSSVSVGSVLDKELINKIKGIQFRARHLVSDSLAGEYQSTFRGRGMEFDEIREYILGDDVRSIDWNVTARMGHPYVKLFRDERELTVMFVVDISASSNFGTVAKFKNEISAEIAALLAYMALRNNDKVGLIVFSDRVEHYLPPKKGRGHVWTVIRDILTYPYHTATKQTDLNVPLKFLNRVLRRKAITFLISDFQGEGFDQQLKVSGHRHDLIAIAVTDPKEMELPNVGYIELEDAETGEFILLDTGNNRFLHDFKNRAHKNQKQQRDFFRSNGIDLIQINTGESYINPIIQFFRSRERRKARG
ncbi:MAG: DUF58 domain-containing protein [Oligoflexia bacterium]|nr:DUF58 domain-containing protein [Oligoflexia bacterium]